jgi:hypothetical protein
MTMEQSAVIQYFNRYYLNIELTQRLFLNINKKIKIFKKMYTTIKIKNFKNKYTSNVRGLSYAYLVGLIEGDG